MTRNHFCLILIPSACALIPPSYAAEPLQARFAQIAQATPGRVGIAAAVLETGESAAWHGGERFPMQSVYKLPIAMAVLRQVDARALQLEQPVRVERADFVWPGQHSPLRDAHPNGGVDVSLRELLRLAVSESDGSASDVLLRVVGGPPRVEAYLHSLDVTGIRVADTEREIGRERSVQYRNWATPEAMVELLRALHEGRGLSPASRALLLAWMTETETGPHRIKSLLPAGTRVAHKTGLSGTTGGFTAATNDVGLVPLPDGRHLAIAVFVSDSTASLAAREGAIAQAARVAWDFFGKSPSSGGR